MLASERLPGLIISLEFTPKETYRIDDLLDIMQLLRSPQELSVGQEQTHQSIRSNLLEGGPWVIEAINAATMPLCEELGDLLMQVVFTVRLLRIITPLTLTTLWTGLQKLILRHPHVFSDAAVSNSKEFSKTGTR